MGRFHRNQSGQALVEYALLASMIALFLVGVSDWVLAALRAYYQEIVSFLILPIP